MNGATKTPRPYQYGHGCAIMILVAEQMGLAPALCDAARQLLDGNDVHPMTGAAIEAEAVRVNGALRHDPDKIALANQHAELLKVKYGFLLANPAT
ncbi:MAG: hypothetical protein FD134_2942 [Gallionellaceae bacterium]|nr:MAG: hypothetical protein FD134_2942 [Gallionellaceae bacterium]